MDGLGCRRTFKGRTRTQTLMFVLWMEDDGSLVLDDSLSLLVLMLLPSDAMVLLVWVWFGYKRMGNDDDRWVTLCVLEF